MSKCLLCRKLIRSEIHYITEDRPDVPICKECFDIIQSELNNQKFVDQLLLKQDTDASSWSMSQGYDPHSLGTIKNIQDA